MLRLQIRFEGVHKLRKNLIIIKSNKNLINFSKDKNHTFNKFNAKVNKAMLRLQIRFEVVHKLKKV